MQDHILGFFGWSGLAGMGWPGLGFLRVGWARLGWAGGGPKRGGAPESQKISILNRILMRSQDPECRVTFFDLWGGLAWSAWAGPG